MNAGEHANFDSTLHFRSALESKTGQPESFFSDPPKAERIRSQRFRFPDPEKDRKEQFLDGKPLLAGGIRKQRPI